MRSCKVAHHELYTIYENGQIHSGKLDAFLTPRLNRNGYSIVTLDGEQLSIHRLVAKHFIPNPYDLPQVNHINGNKQCNHFTNLEWVTPKENNQHALRTGLRKGFVHVDVRRQMLARALTGELVSDLATEVGNHPNTLNRMLREQARKDGLEQAWKEETARKRKQTALRNLEKINA